MSKATFNGQFAELNKKHDYSINCIENLLSSKARAFWKLPGKNNSGCDLMIVKKGCDMPTTVEVKTNSGVSQDGSIKYNTFLVETYADYDMTRLPEWRNEKYWVDQLFIHNLYKNEIYVYDVSMLRAYVKENEHLQVKSGASVKTKSADNTKCSWGIKIPWECEEAGYIQTLIVKDLPYGQTSNYNEPLYPTKHRQEAKEACA